MAEPRDDRVSAAYRELPDDGPPPALDAAIQAAARRAVSSRPVGTRRWQIPVSIAAVLALAIGISLHVDREKPLVADGTPVSSGSAEYPVPQAQPEPEERPVAQTGAAAPAARLSAPAASEAMAKRPATPPPAEAKRMEREAPSPAPLASKPSAAIAESAPPREASRPPPQPALRAKSEVARDAASLEKPRAIAEPPERLLERIAELRAKGLHEEADRALAEFRRTNPGYRISDEWLRKVERP